MSMYIDHQMGYCKGLRNNLVYVTSSVGRGKQTISLRVDFFFLDGGANYPDYQVSSC